MLSWGIPLCLAFVATPIIVRGIGTEQYGIYAVILGFLSYAFSSGIGKVAGKYVPEFRASGETEKLSAAVSAAFWLTLAVGVLQAVILTVTAPYIVNDILLIPAANADIVLKALYLAAFSGLVLMVSQVFQFSLQGLHRFDLFAVITNVGAILSAAGNIWLVLAGYGVLPLIAWNAIVAAITGVIFFAAVKPLLPEWGLSFIIGREIFGSVLRYSGSIIVYQALTSVLLLFERSWIVRKFGAEALSFYVLPMMLAVYMHGLLASFSQVLFPVVNELLTDREGLIRLYGRATKVVLVLTAFILSGYVGSGQAFLGLWIGGEFAERSYILLILIGCAFAVNIIAMIVWLLAEAFRTPGLNALSSTIWAVTAIPLMIVFARNWGIEGVAMGRLVGVLFTIPLIPYIEKRFLGRVMWQFWAATLVRLLPAAAAAIGVERLLFGRVEASWPVLIASVLTGSATFAAVLLVAGFFSREELDLARSRVPFLRKQTVG